jgi:glucose-6-phosphate isomerase
MIEAKLAYERAGLDFGEHSVAITQKNSELDKIAIKEKWIRRFPMWDWVGGRTSEMSAVGLLPAALQGFDVDQMLAGAKACDILTRSDNVTDNPSLAIALAWHALVNGRGEKDMVIVPYKDRLDLLSKYLQQLIMESLGKEADRDGAIVNQGISVYGNKGSTDQHAYIQQLRDGVHNFFVTFIEVLKDREDRSPEVEKGITSGDYLSGFFLGTREALYENGRQSITLTLKEISPFSIGVLIALFERAVGFYASLVNINAYHQPGVQAGKKAADAVIALQGRVVNWLQRNRGEPFSAEAIASAIGCSDCEVIFKVCEHLAANPDRRIIRKTGKTIFESTYHLA